MSASIDATSAARLRALLAELEAFLSDQAAVVLGCGAIAGDPATLDGVDRAYYDDLVRLAAACAAAEAAFAAGEDGAAIDPSSQTATLDFAALRVANAARQKEWDPDARLGLLFFAVAMAGEAGEACNVVKKIERKRLGLPGSYATLDKLAEELADVVIYADLVAASVGLDLGAAVRSKFNATSKKLGMATYLAESADQEAAP